MIALGLRSSDRLAGAGTVVGGVIGGVAGGFGGDFVGGRTFEAVRGWFGAGR